MKFLYHYDAGEAENTPEKSHYPAAVPEKTEKSPILSIYEILFSNIIHPIA
jgi:hypothetical protein